MAGRRGEKRYAHELGQPGVYGFMAASPLMGILYGARSCRPDEIVPTLRLARRVSKWTLFDDRKLMRLLGYIRASAGLALSGGLSTRDLSTAVVRCWPDADLAGEPAEDAKSTSGLWLEIASADGERSMAIHWGMRKQTSTSDSTTVAELDSMHSGLKLEALPVIELVEFFLGQS